jgi:hypothetical protein
MIIPFGRNSILQNLTELLTCNKSYMAELHRVMNNFGEPMPPFFIFSKTEKGLPTNLLISLSIFGSL